MRRLAIPLLTATVVMLTSACALSRASHQDSQTSNRASQPRYTKLIWSDEFTGPAGTPLSPSKWIHDVGAWGYPDNELETYTDSPANASLDGRGHLAIVARRQTETGPDRRTRNYTSARLETQGLFSAEYGLIEVRMKIPAGAGLWPAFWLLGDDMKTVGWPACGEIDVLEALGQQPSSSARIHQRPQQHHTALHSRARSNRQVVPCLGLSHVCNQVEAKLDHMAARRRSIRNRHPQGSSSRSKVGVQPSFPPRAQPGGRGRLGWVTKLIDTVLCDVAGRLGSGL